MSDNGLNRNGMIVVYSGLTGIVIELRIGLSKRKKCEMAMWAQKENNMANLSTVWY
jgi:hypothetical protein